uniref:Xylose isomerase n=1 Tax=Lepisosteus oculatus TaxID=7918 RepID=W5MST7_LEPOC
VLLGRTMEDWLRFSVCYWHSFCGTVTKPCVRILSSIPKIEQLYTTGEPIDRLNHRFHIFFSFFLQVKYYTFHDRDLAPEGGTLEETNRNLDEITDLALELQRKTGIKVLWATCNLFAHPRSMAMLGLENSLLTLLRGGIKLKLISLTVAVISLHNSVNYSGEGELKPHNITLVTITLKTLASFYLCLFQFCAAYKEKIGLKCQFLIEPKPKEPCKHQYDYDAMSVIGFLKHFELDSYFKLNIEPNHTTLAGHSYEHDIIMASAFGMLGSVDSNTGSPDLGWDTDQFPMDIKNTTMVMKCVIEQGGLQPGGLNFDAKVRRESTDLEDLFIAHVGAMDTFARGLRSAVQIIEEGVIAQMLQQRYLSFSSGIGSMVEEGTATLVELEEFIKQNGEPKTTSGKQEKYESIFNHYL